MFGSVKENFSGCFLSKHTVTGELEWINFIEGAGAILSSRHNSLVINEKHQSLYIAGRIYDSVSFPDTILYLENGNKFVARYSTDGTFQWVIQVASNGDMNELYLATDNQGNVIFTGDVANQNIKPFIEGFLPGVICGDIAGLSASNFLKNKGYGTLEHREAIARFGPSPLHRRSFKGVKEYCH